MVIVRKEAGKVLSKIFRLETPRNTKTDKPTDYDLLD